MTMGIEDLMEKFSITEEEGVGVTLEDVDGFKEDKLSAFRLVGRLLTTRSVNFDAFQRTMKKSWGLEKDAAITRIGQNLFLFQFQCESDMDKVALRGPWNFDNKLLVLGGVKGDEQPNSIALFWVSFWVRIYNLPLSAMREEVGHKVGGLIGKVEVVDAKEDGSCLGQYIRVRVNLDVRKPLKRGTMVSIGKGRTVWVDFRYERLTTICFCCGVLGHMDSECSEALKQCKEDGRSVIQYGTWLRASTTHIDGGMKPDLGTEKRRQVTDEEEVGEDNLERREIQNSLLKRVEGSDSVTNPKETRPQPRRFRRFSEGSRKVGDQSQYVTEGSKRKFVANDAIEGQQKRFCTGEERMEGVEGLGEEELFGYKSAEVATQPCRKQ